jgi:hypothetical protein
MKVSTQELTVGTVVPASVPRHYGYPMPVLTGEPDSSDIFALGVRTRTFRQKLTLPNPATYEQRGRAQSRHEETRD